MNRHGELVDLSSWSRSAGRQVVGTSKQLVLDWYAILVEQVDRLSRLNNDDWQRLKAELQSRRVRVVALDLPTSWMLTANTDDITGRMLDMLAAIARKDYDDRRRRQAQGIAKLKAAGGYPGRKPDEQRNAAIMNMLRRGDSWNSIVAATGCSRSTLSRLARQVKEEAAAEGVS